MLERASMQPTHGTIASAGSPCRACGAVLPADKSVCAACGAAQGEENRCPHCTAIADVQPHPTLGFVCRVCGGPRIAIDARFAVPSQSTTTALVAAGREQTKHLMFSAAGFLLGGMGALGLLIASVVVLAASPGLVPSLAAFLAASVPFVAGLLALRRAAQARAQRSEALHSARVAALGDVQAVTGPLDATRAAEILRLDPEQAELLLAERSVLALLRDTPEPRLRVEPPRATVLDESVAEAEAGPQTEKQRGQTEI
jgi:hypothetical protein